MSVFYDIPILIPILTFVAIFLFVIGVNRYFRMLARKGAMIDKIREAGEGTLRVYRDPALIEAEEKAEKRPNPLMNLFSFIGTRLVSGKDEKQRADATSGRAKFLNAGIRHPNAPAMFWGAKIFFTVLFVSIFIFCRLTVLRLAPAEVIFLLGIVAAAIGLYIPEIWLDLKIAKRKKMIFRGLPDALDLMVVCVEAGMGLDSAMTKVAQEINLTCPSLSEELRIMNLELRAGKSRENALKNMAVRVGLDDMSNLATMLIQSERFGTSSSKALRVYSDTFRSRRFSLAEEQAAKIAIKLMFPMIFFIFPSLFVVIAGPAVIQIYQTIIKQ